MSDSRFAASALMLATLALAACSPGDEPPAANKAATPAQSADEPARELDAEQLAKLDNPKPLPGDVSLPLPCGGEMVFRHVYILSQGSLDDREVSLGYPFSEGEAGYKQSFISGYRRDFINGQFSLQDLAPQWQKQISERLPKIDAGSPLKPMMYFIGKYEVTARQYAQVMAQAAVTALET